MCQAKLKNDATYYKLFTENNFQHINIANKKHFCWLNAFNDTYKNESWINTVLD